MSATRHRDDIEGLRAVAIIPIILFHSGISALSGGFVGVDIFFVISGYLITSIVLRDMTAGRFSLLGFYRRRMVRIFPALFAMLIIVLAFAMIILLPIEFERLAHSAMAATGFASNLYFWRTSDYFSPAAELMPLLHTWSLGVEEQFYIFYPFFLLLVTRFWARGLRLLLPLAALASLGLGALVALHSPVAAFYLLPFRAWELLLGAMLAAGIFPQVTRQGGRAALALAGALLVVAAVFLVRAGAYFPVPLGLLPCIGTALLIGYGEGTPVGRLLEWAPLRWIGRISYSVYLWHWPIIALYRTETGISLDLKETALLVAASIAAGAASYYLVERPFMSRFRDRGSSRRIVAGGILAVVAGVAGVFLLNASASTWRRIDPQVAQVAAYADYTDRPEYQYQFRRGPCFRGEAQSDIPFDPAQCLALDAVRRNVVILGDSYAAQFWRAFALRYPDRNVMQATASGCRPIIGTQGELRCREVVDRVLGPLLATRRIDTIVLAARWLEDEVGALPQTIRHIQRAGTRVVVIGPTVEYEGEFPSILGRALARGEMNHVDAWIVRDRFALDERMARIVAPTGATYVSPIRLMCRAEHCLLRTGDGGPAQFDYGHLTLAGSRYVVDRMPPL